MSQPLEQVPHIEAPEQEVNAEVNAPVTPEQAEFLGRKPVELVQMPDGTITTKDVVAQEISAGHEITGPYSGGHR
jgi:hypothetical protein